MTYKQLAEKYPHLVEPFRAIHNIMSQHNLSMNFGCGCCGSGIDGDDDKEEITVMFEKFAGDKKCE